jgi:hypothetical protein
LWFAASDAEPGDDVVAVFDTYFVDGCFEQCFAGWGGPVREGFFDVASQCGEFRVGGHFSRGLLHRAEQFFSAAS